jgi:predicted phosphodiesterase
MRYLILSDLHANVDAFSAVLARVRRKRFDRIVVLGDLVGYGGAPNRTVDLVRTLAGNPVVIRGNHDKVASGLDAGQDFNATARLAASWTERRLTPANLRYVRELAQGPTILEAGLWICHGSPLDEDQYLLSSFDALDVFEQTDFPIVFFGHTHLPMFFACQHGAVRMVRIGEERTSLVLDPDARYLINPGSIGQPRDRDPRASFVTYDSTRRVVTWHRVRYPVERARQRILKAGLPQGLGNRLLHGV